MNALSIFHQFTRSPLFPSRSARKCKTRHRHEPSRRILREGTSFSFPMQTASGSLQLGPVRLELSIVFGPAFSIVGEARECTTFDSRFMVPLKERCATATHLYILLEGFFHWDDGIRFEAPAAFLAPAVLFEGEFGQRRASYRAGGARFRAVEVRVSGDVFGVVERTAPEQVVLSDDSMVCASNFVAASSNEERMSSALDLLTSLRREGLFIQDLTPRSFLENVIET